MIEYRIILDYLFTADSVKCNSLKTAKQYFQNFVDNNGGLTAIYLQKLVDGKKTKTIKSIQL